MTNIAVHRSTPTLLLIITLLLSGSVVLFAPIAQADKIKPNFTYTFNCYGGTDPKLLDLIKQQLLARFDMRVNYVNVTIPELKQGLEDGTIQGDCARAAYFPEEIGLSHLRRINAPAGQATLDVWKSNTSSVDDFDAAKSIGYSLKSISAPHYLRANTRVPTIPVAKQEDQVPLLLEGAFDLLVTHDIRQGLVHDQRNAIIKLERLISVPVFVHFHKDFPEVEAPMRAMIDYIHSLNTTNASREQDVPHQSDDQLIISCAIPPASYPFTRLKQAFEIATESIGKKLQFISLPLALESRLLSTGRIDGICGRAASYYKNKLSVIRLDVVGANGILQLWKTSDPQRINTDNVLRKATKIGVLSGSHQDFVDRLRQQGMRIYPAASLNHGYKMLNTQRIDYFLTLDLSANGSFTADTASETLYSAGTLGRIKYYPGLLVKNADLLQPLTLALANVLENRGTSTLSD